MVVNEELLHYGAEIALIRNLCSDHEHWWVTLIVSALPSHR